MPADSIRADEEEPADTPPVARPAVESEPG
jgi:hypothetical protein